jgi:hypothetical protein
MFHRDFKIRIVEEIIKEFCQRYRDTLEEHPNNPAAVLFVKARRMVRKLEKKRRMDLLS